MRENLATSIGRLNMSEEVSLTSGSSPTSGLAGRACPATCCCTATLAIQPRMMARRFASTGGYGEMSVDGITVMCDKVKKVFNRVTYCPLLCARNPNDPMCKNCMQGGGGNF